MEGDAEPQPPPSDAAGPAGEALPQHPVLELETRRRIFQRIRKVPGIHFRSLQRDLGMPLGTLEYNLHQLEKAELVVTREEGRYKAYYPNQDLDRRDRDHLYYLRQRTPRAIAMHVVARPGIRFQELVLELALYPSRLSTLLRRLVDAGILEEQRVGREKAYVCPDADRVKRLIIQYRVTFVDAMVDRFAATWAET